MHRNKCYGVAGPGYVETMAPSGSDVPCIALRYSGQGLTRPPEEFFLQVIVGLEAWDRATEPLSKDETKNFHARRSTAASAPASARRVGLGDRSAGPPSVPHRPSSTLGVKSAERRWLSEFEPPLTLPDDDRLQRQSQSAHSVSQLIPAIPPQNWLSPSRRILLLTSYFLQLTTRKTAVASLVHNTSTVFRRHGYLTRGRYPCPVLWVHCFCCIFAWMVARIYIINFFFFLISSLLVILAAAREIFVPLGIAPALPPDEPHPGQPATLTGSACSNDGLYR
ncbi:hypothetical protein IF1G_02876 [Cordyceps javanica]|uniref:Uncharacterized protein n=1 Tax=Cordyceps javanica TaxID=43265 RepID=A0A545VAN7_9HYPO|nr:hypothetical protein IF1G_02876 [Cordyceps javanica]